MWLWQGGSRVVTGPRPLIRLSAGSARCAKMEAEFFAAKSCGRHLCPTPNPGEERGQRETLGHEFQVRPVPHEGVSWSTEIWGHQLSPITPPPAATMGRLGRL